MELSLSSLLVWIHATLLSVEKLMEDSFFENIIEDRYKSYDEGIGENSK